MSHTMLYAALMLCIILIVAVVLLVRNRAGRGGGSFYGGGTQKQPDWLSTDTQCPPPAPAQTDLETVVAGRILGAPTASRSNVQTPADCAQACMGHKGKCSGWAFAKSRPSMQGDGTYTCQTFTIDDKDIIMYPPATAGDYMSNSLSCAPRSGPTSITDLVTEAAIFGEPAAHVGRATTAGDCLERCKKMKGCIGATFHGHNATCHLYQTPKGLVLKTMPGTHHATSASLFAGEYSIPVEPAPLPGMASAVDD